MEDLTQTISNLAAGSGLSSAASMATPSAGGDGGGGDAPRSAGE